MTKAAIVGSGTMGPGIVATLSRGGFEARVFDTSPDARERTPGDAEVALGVLERIGGQAAAERGAVAVFDNLAEAVAGADLVIEAVPAAVGTAVTAAVGIPTIGIGAGPGCDGQVLVFHDVLGLGTRKTAKFVRQYANLAEDATKALAEFAADVRTGAFPGVAESYESSDDLRHALDLGPEPKTR